jgi:hypothetical protein
MAQMAFDVLRSNDHAIKRAAYEASEKRLKVVLARAEGRSEAKSKGDRESEALRSDEYSEALNQFEAIAEAYYMARDKRDAASACLDAWRTQRSDQRAMGKV